ncbi:penicillin-binding transpeptidase domain-containing protein [Jeotgalibacillus sp. ET6]|uniref:penicillin-binding transpeptidase domain-containing protein n=1 Tax=Jeotgalibacillus sp. ET6 TaxID=3037260 RepID=UPI0024182482|nr:penicillin-binding transpeptidase domain-containing protein [Jeotgalibacillus sp. ET6]MDG5472245.1 penicillin-binding transpeptidase domain-containing protein [Jeotgalibacillus sp. ET6]
MKKALIGSFLFTGVLFLAGCSDPVTPDERLEEYINLWNNQEFDQMYSDYTSADTKETFTKEEAADRMAALYADLEVTELEVTMPDVAEDAEWEEGEPASFTVPIRFQTLAGPVDYEQDITVVFEETEENENWFIRWQPALILPELEAGDQVRIADTPGVRGELFDRNGNPLAVNGTGYQVGAVSGELTDEAKTELAEELSLSTETIDEQLAQDWVQAGQFVPLKKVSSSQRDKVADLSELDGITYQEIEMREYPYGEAASHLTGYIGAITAEQLEEMEGEGYTATDQIGKRGLEQLLEDQLRAETGRSILIEKGEEETVTVAEQPAEDGEDITLTIDAELQKTAFEAMKGKQGTAAAVDPETGETLVLASSPGFDPGEWSLGISGERYTELSEDPDAPLLNRFAAAYAPGSTQKTITAAIGLEAGTLDPEEGYTINGLEWQDEGWGDFAVTRVHEAPNPIDLNKGLVFSDNIYFARVALEMGKETLIDGLENMGYGEELPFVYPMSDSQISNDGSIGSEGQLVDTSYGQGEMLTNILHLASMYETVVNDGVMMKPLLFESEEQEVWKEGLLSPKHAEILRGDLREVVTEGFAGPADIPEVQIAGKTGTAELKQSGEESGKENGFFVAYNQEDPAFILAMMIEGVEDEGGSTYVSELAAEVFQNQ